MEPSGGPVGSTRTFPTPRWLRWTDPSCGSATGTLTDSEIPAVHEQLIVFAPRTRRALSPRTRPERRAGAGPRQSAGDLHRDDEELGAGHRGEGRDDARPSGSDADLRPLARRTGGPGSGHRGLGYGFFLHDIGKVGIPEQILCKRGPLSPDEWEIMRTHPLVGAQIVAPIAFLHGAVALVRNHHERFDGTGYPDGLRGSGSRSRPVCSPSRTPSTR